MASSNLVQFLQIGVDAAAMNRRTVEKYIAGGTIAAGDWVTFDGSQSGTDRMLYVVEAAATATVGNAGAMGVALNAVSAGEIVDVVIGGYVAAANVAAATVAGSSLVGPIGTAGEAAIEVPGTTTGCVCGIALEADTANVAAVFVIKKF